MMVGDRQFNSRQGVIATLLVGVAIVVGGGGSPAPFPELVVQLAAVLAVVVWALVSRPPFPRAPREAWFIAAILIGLPLLQLVSLPPALWHSMPGREAERAALALAGGAGDWRPWSVAPGRTLASLLAMMVPAAVLVMTASLARSGRTMVMVMIAAGAFASLLVGAGQLTGGEGSAFRYYVSDAGYLNGFQANHNSAADVLLIGMVAFTGALREWSERRARSVAQIYLVAVTAAAGLLFSLGVFLTASRAGIALLPVAWIGMGLIAAPWLRMSRRSWRLALIALVLGGGLFTLEFASSGTVARVMGRFDFEGEFRPQLWQDAVFAVRQYFPWGSGMGTFVPVFIAIERLEAVDSTLPNRAHNDFLELAMESGVLGVIALALIGALLARRMLAIWREGPLRRDAHLCFGGAALAIVALHSQVDYPLRSLSLACIAAAAAGLLMPGVSLLRRMP